MTEPATSKPSAPPGPPPKWKFAVIVLLGLYPLLIVIIPFMGWLFGSPFTITGQFLVRTLATVLVVVPLMVWIAIPLLSKLFRGWLQA